MKIAVPITRNNKIDDHFGHCEYYGIYSISESGEIKEEDILESVQGCGCKSNIASDLAQIGVSVMLAGGIGAGAINVLNNSGIEVIRGCSGDVLENVKHYASGKLTDSGVSCSTHTEHHAEGENHQCGHNH